MYQYNAIVQKVIDGDTMEIDIDLGLSVWVHKEKIRLFGINTPEVYGVKKGSPEWEKGNLASEFVKSIVKANDNVVIQTIKDQKEKYGRYLGLIYIEVESSVISGLSAIRKIENYYCLNDILIEKGLAEPYMI